jgi:hypothetical protein
VQYVVEVVHFAGAAPVAFDPYRNIGRAREAARLALKHISPGGSVAIRFVEDAAETAA